MCEKHFSPGWRRGLWLGCRLDGRLGEWLGWIFSVGLADGLADGFSGGLAVGLMGGMAGDLVVGLADGLADDLDVGLADGWQRLDGRLVSVWVGSSIYATLRRRRSEGLGGVVGLWGMTALFRGRLFYHVTGGAAALG